MVHPAVQSPRPARVRLAAHPGRQSRLEWKELRRLAGSPESRFAAHQVLHREPGGSVPRQRLLAVPPAGAGADAVVWLATLQHMAVRVWLSRLSSSVFGAQPETYEEGEVSQLGMGHHVLISHRRFRVFSWGFNEPYTILSKDGFD